MAIRNKKEWQQFFDIKTTDGVMTLTLDNESEKINKLSTPAMEALEELFDKIALEKSVKVLVIKSAKPSIFIAGADINEIKDITKASQ